MAMMLVRGRTEDSTYIEQVARLHTRTDGLKMAKYIHYTYIYTYYTFLYSLDKVNFYCSNMKLKQFTQRAVNVRRA